jgi:beta-lactam-binding protein with PASTA domain
MADESSDYTRVVRVHDLYLAFARALDLANRTLEEGSSGDVSYAIVDTQIGVAYGDLFQSEGQVVLRLAEQGETVDATRYLRFTLRPMPGRATTDDATGENGPVTVPDLVNTSIDDALSMLTGSGYRVGKIVYEIGQKPEGRVLAQRPEAGKEVKKGTSIDLRVSGESLRVEIPPESLKLEGAKEPQKGESRTSRKTR